MCGTKSNLCSSKSLTETDSMRLKQEEEEAMRSRTTTGLLEFAACDDLPSFKREIEEKGLDVDQPGLWYCRQVGSKKMGVEERTPLMVAAMYGSTEVLNFIISMNKADVNKVCGDERVTALHCAVAGCAFSIVEIIKILLDASAEPNCVDVNGNKPVDLFAKASRFVPSSSRKAVELLLSGNLMDDLLNLEKEGEDQKGIASPGTKYPADASLPDINEGIYGTDEFRMFSFKVKPCSRAYSHDWTECPFVHPGENARRRDPRKYPYTCVPCPEFRKGSCPKGDSCEYAHGVFESWLHPAQYRTRLCKDETGCARRVCFFAHKREELRPVNASTGSAMVSPRSGQSPEMPAMSPLTLGSSALPYSPTFSSPLNSPMANGVPSSPRNNGTWQSRVNSLTPPTLQLSSSRLKSSLSARDMDMEMELRFRNLDNQMSFGRLGDLKVVKPSNLEESFGAYDSSSVMSPSRHSQNIYSSSPHGFESSSSAMAAAVMNARSSPHGFESSSAMAAAVMNARSSAFAKRSLSFKPAPVASSNLADWGSPNGKLEWGMQREELNKLRRSSSFGIHGNNYSNNNSVVRPARDYGEEPDVSWVNSLVKEERSFAVNDGGVKEKLKVKSWAEQMYIEHEKQQIVA